MLLLTEKQLSEILKVSVRTLQAQRQKGFGIPYCKIGRSVRYDMDAIQQYLQQNNFISTSQVANAYFEGQQYV